jgi:hypothetical protein
MQSYKILSTNSVAAISDSDKTNSLWISKHKNWSRYAWTISNKRRLCLTQPIAVQAKAATPYLKKMLILRRSAAKRQLYITLSQTNITQLRQHCYTWRLLPPPPPSPAKTHGNTARSLFNNQPPPHTHTRARARPHTRTSARAHAHTHKLTPARGYHDSTAAFLLFFK